jgi:hypothetical protein
VQSGQQWMRLDGGYSASIDGNRLSYRDQAGAKVKSLPGPLRSSTAVIAADGLATWLGGHARRCRLIVETWVLRGYAVPHALLVAVWPDRVWRQTLTDLVVTDPAGRGGLLRAVHADGVDVIDGYGATQRISGDAWRIPHPALIPALSSYRALLGGRTPAVAQVLRDVAVRPADLPAGHTQCGDFAGIGFGKAEKVLRRAGRYAFTIRFGHAVCPVWEDGRLVEARLYLGDDYLMPSLDLDVGALTWVGSDGWDMPLEQVGPVAWSEGIRMARLLTEDGSPVQPDDSGARWKPPVGPAAATVGERMPVTFDQRGVGERGAGRLVVPVPAYAGNLSDERLTEPVHGRRYTHPALAGAIVRLVPEPLASDVDAAMAWYGCTLEGTAPDVGTSLPVALEFVDYALAREPDSGVHVVAMASELAKLAEIAANRPADARKGYSALAKTLRAKAPTLTTRLYEQASRAFLASGYAGGQERIADKTEQAKKFHQLPPDTVHLGRFAHELAIGGAYPYVLSEYADLLTEQTDPATAYRAVREMASVWLAHGMVVEQATMLALLDASRAAGIDDTAHEVDLVREILASPAVASNDDVWRLNGLTVLAEREPAVRRQMASMRPAHLWRLAAGDWLTVLERVNALAWLTTTDADTVPVEARPSLAPAEWLNRVIETVQGTDDYGWKQVQDHYSDLLRAMAPRLAAEGIPVDLTGGLLHRASVEVIDLALELGIPLADPPVLPMDGLELHYGEGARPLEYIVADPRFGPLVVRAALSERMYIERYPALHGPVADHVFGDLDQLGRTGGLSTLWRDLDHVNGSELAYLLSARPQARAKIAAADVGAALAFALRGGLLDEFAWPALEQAVAGLPVPPDGRYRMSGCWPYLIVEFAGQAAVVAHDRVVHSGPRPAGTGHLSYVDDQLIVVPSKEFNNNADSALPYSMALPDGRRTEGGVPFGADGPPVSGQHRLFTDGRTWWRVDGGTLGLYVYPAPEHTELVAFDPGTGTVTNQPEPELFAAARADGITVDPEISFLVTLPDGVRSPLGQIGNVSGLAGGFAATGERIVRRLDGTTVTLPSPDYNRQTVFLVDMPGGDRARTLYFQGNFWSMELASPEVEYDGRSYVMGHRSPNAPGWTMVPPPIYWHYLVVRDAAGSAALRGVDRDLCAAMVAAAQTGEEASAVIGRLLPAITEPGLRAGVAAVLATAVDLAERARTMAAAQLPEPVPEPVVEPEPEVVREPEPPRLEEKPYEDLHPYFKGIPLAQGGYVGGMSLLAEADDTPVLRPSTSTIDSFGDVTDTGLGGPMAFTVAVYTSWTYLHLPAGHPVRNGIPRALERTRLALESPDLIVALGKYAADHRSEMAALIGDSPTLSKVMQDRILADGGAVLAINVVRDYDTARFFVRPGVLAPERLAEVARLVHFRGYGDTGNAEAIEFLRSAAATTMAERVATGAVPVGRYESDPRACVPALVEQVRTTNDLSEDAATLYLQTLTLPTPYAAWVCRYNDWPHERYEAAAKELAARDLVVTGERKDAERSIFLPGGWERLQVGQYEPVHALEEWKIALYGRDPKGPIALAVCLTPAHELFARAWARVLAGDGPRFG